MNIAFVCLQAQQDDSIIPHIIMGIMVFVVMYYLLVVRRKKLEAQEKSAEETFEYQQQPEISNPSSVKCPFCNNFINAEDVFCVHCGKKLPDNKESSDTKVCPKCKTPIGENDLFCSNCGEAL